MKYIIALSLCIVSLGVFAQDAGFDGHKWEAPYHLPAPKDWGIERFLLPASFAPEILYKGVEDIRFAPGWANVKSEEYWTYAFLWYLDGSPQTDASIIEANLKAYYTGLLKVNSDSAKAAAEKPMPVVTSFKKAATATGDAATYTGTVSMRDYMQRTAITLHCVVHIRSCPEENKTILFYELSPKPFEHKNWIALNQLWLEFTCKKK